MDASLRSFWIIAEEQNIPGSVQKIFVYLPGFVFTVKTGFFRTTLGKKLYVYIFL